MKPFDQVLLVLKVNGLKGGLIGGAPCFPWPCGWLNRFLAFSSNRPRALHGDLVDLELKRIRRMMMMKIESDLEKRFG